MIGTRVGQYELVEEIGKGGMATVYRAYQPNVDRFVAVKVINRAILDDETAMERFTREARLVVKLEHPHLLPVYDYDARHDPPYIVMRYLESGTLKDVLENGALPMREAAFMLQQLSSALDYAHRQGVVHRDIKPSNIMIDADGNAFLMDFGIARAGDGKEGLTQTGFSVGTPGYMSPEQALGTDVDQRTDIYALGVVLFQMVTGEMPYTSETPMGLILKHMQDPVPVATETNPDLPDDIDDIIAIAMAKNPDDRYQSGDEMVEALMDVVGNVTATKAPTQLRLAAKLAIERLQNDRNTRKDEIDATMATFAKMRSGDLDTGTGAGTMEDAPTMMTPTDQQAVTLPDPQGNTPEPATSGRNTLMIVGGVVAVAVIVIVGALLALGGGGDDDADATATRAAFLASITDTPAPTDTTEPTATPTDEPTATDTVEPTVTNTNEPTATRTPSITPTNPPPTPRTPVAQALRELSIRLGPGANFPEVGTFEEGDELDILGVSESGVWFEVLLPNGTRGWILSSQRFVQFAGDEAIVEIAQAPTLTPTDTATATERPTNTPTATATDTPAPTNTDEPTATDTPAPTATDEPTATDTPQPTDTPTLTPTDIPTDTPQPTDTPEPTNTPLPTETFTPTPIPPGRLPFGSTFDSDAALADWTFNPDVWEVDTFEGESALVGQGRLSEHIVLLGESSPQWEESSSGDFVMTFDFYLEQGSGGLRLVYRYQENDGYAALEILPNLLIFRRENNNNADVNNRDNERVVRLISNSPIRAGEWQHATLWVQDNRLSVYIDRELVLREVDPFNRTPDSGEILFQPNSVTRSVAVDNLSIETFDPLISQNFEGRSVPQNYTGDAELVEEDDNNNYIVLSRDAELNIESEPLENFTLRTRVYVENGNYEMLLRASPEGALRFNMEVTGDLLIEHITPEGDVLDSRRVNNFYTRNRWQDMEITLNGDRLTVYLDGRERYDDTFDSLPPAGNIRFQTRGLSILRLDEVILTRDVPIQP